MRTRRQSTGGQVANSSAGIAVDASGAPANDPSENVSTLNEAGHKRQDDLRKSNNRLFESEIRRLDTKIKCGKEMADLREKHNKQMRGAEAARLDSIRQVDVTAVRTEATRALEAIQTLAATSARDAENLRNTLTSTATTIAKSTSDTVSQITERLTALERSSYEGVGKQRIADPQMMELAAEVKALRESRASTTGVGQGIDKMWGVVGIAATLIISGTVAFVTIKSAPTAAPQIVYVPAPSPSSPGGSPPVVTAPATVVAPAAPRVP